MKYRYGNIGEHQLAGSWFSVVPTHGELGKRSQVPIRTRIYSGLQTCIIVPMFESCPPPPPTEIRSKRVIRSHKKSRKGCVQCKKRRVKPLRTTQNRSLVTQPHITNLDGIVLPLRFSSGHDLF
ncbi:hypothetical protein L218DRAFT_1072261, partial [Marasmius fiardii PR-910]